MDRTILRTEGIILKKATENIPKIGIILSGLNSRCSKKNIIPHNIVVGYEDNLIVLKIIDGLGSSSFVPLPEMSDFFAKRYIERRIQLMWSRINWDLSGRKGNWK